MLFRVCSRYLTQTWNLNCKQKRGKEARRDNTNGVTVTTKGSKNVDRSDRPSFSTLRQAQSDAWGKGGGVKCRPHFIEKSAPFVLAVCCCRCHFIPPFFFSFFSKSLGAPALTPWPRGLKLDFLVGKERGEARNKKCERENWTSRTHLDATFDS